MRGFNPYAFQSCSSLKRVVIPDSVSVIGGGSFTFCTSLGEVVLGDGLTGIGGHGNDSTDTSGDNGYEQYGAFAGCVSLTNIVFGSSLRSIGNQSFTRCAVSRLVFPDTVTSIGVQCFYGSSLLGSVTFGNRIASIGAYAFGNCPCLRYLNFRGDPPTTVGNNAFNKMKSAAIIYRADDNDEWSETWRGYAVKPASEITADADAPYDLVFYKKGNWESAFFLADKMNATNACARFIAGRPIYSTYGSFEEWCDLAIECNTNTLYVSGVPETWTEGWGAGQHAVNRAMASESKLPSNLQNLAPGEYTATWVLNEPRLIRETNYANNSNSVAFVVVPSTLVSFMSEDNVVAADYFEKGGTYGTLPVTPLRPYYNFTGWFTDADGGNVVTETSKVPDSPATLYAHWEIRPAQTNYVSGAVSASATWRTGDLYVVRDNLTISNGAALTIEPGVIVKFAAGKSLTVNSGGTLQAVGTRALPIVFTSIKDDANGGDTNGDGIATEPQAGDWHQIKNNGTANIEYAKVLYCSAVNNQGALYPCAGTMRFKNSTVAHCQYDCMRGAGGIFIAENSVFTDASMGAAPQSGKSTFVNCVFCSLTTAVRWGNGTFANCIFADVAQDIIDTKFYSATLSSKFSNCCFWNPEGTGDRAAAKVGKDGNFYANPLFVNPANGDFRIAANSPCVDAGDGTVAPEKDYYGLERRDVGKVTDSGVPSANGNCPDIGIHEVLWDEDESPYDIVPTAVSVDKTKAKVGDKVKVSWTIQNLGTEDVVGGWHDAVSLISTSGQSVELGEVLTTYTLKRKMSMNVNRTFTIPALSEGTWYARVNTNNRRSDVPEGLNTTNNVLTSVQGVAISVAATPYADGASGTLSAGSSTVVKFTFPAGTTGQIARVSVPAGLSVSYGLGFVPQGAYASGTMTATEKGEAIFHVPAGTAEVYLVMDAAQSDGQNYSVSFESGDLAILSVSPNAIPPDEIVSITLDGIGLDNVANIVMSLDSGGSIPTRVSYTSKERVVIEVDGEGLVAGSEMQISIDSVVVGKVLVSSGGRKENIWARLIVPDSVREGRVVACYVEYGNSGDKSGTLPIFEVIADEPCKLRYTGDETWREVLRFFGVGGSENADMLLPGEVRRFEFLMKAGATNNVRLRMGDGQTYGIKDCDTVLVRKTVRRLSRLGVDATDYSIVGNIAQLVSQNPDTLIVTGFAVNTYGEPCDGVGVHIVASESAEGIFSSAVTDRNGFFYMTGITNGVYRFESADSVIVDGVDEFVVMNSDIGGKMIVVENSLSFYVAITNLNEGETISATAVKESDDTVYGSVMITDGYVQFRGLPEGMYTLEVRSSLGRLCRMAVSLPKLEGDVIDVELHDACSFNGYFVDFAENERGGVLVFCPDGHVFFEGLDVEGGFSVSDVVPGDYTLITVMGDEARYCVTNLTLVPGSSPNMVFEKCVGNKSILNESEGNERNGRRKSAVLKGSFWSDLIDNINAVKNGKTAIKNHRELYKKNFEMYEENSKLFLSACTACITKDDHELVERLRFNLQQYLDEIHCLERAVAKADAGVNSDLLSNIMGAGSDFFSAMAKMMEFKNFGTTRAQFINGIDSIVSDSISFLENVRNGQDVGTATANAITGVNDMIKDISQLRESLDRFSSMELNGIEGVKEVLRMVSSSVDAYDKAVGLANKVAMTSPNTTLGALAKRIVDGDKALGPARPLIDSIGKAAAFILKLEAIGTDSTLAEWGRLMDAIRYEIESCNDMNAYLFREIFSLVSEKMCRCPASSQSDPALRKPGSKCKCNEEDKNKKLEDQKKPKVPKSCDPNEMVGPEGTGEARYVQPGGWVTYTIYFENKTNATAAAQEVFVTNPLSEWLDWSTFEMGEVSFGNQIDLGLSGSNGGASEVQMNGTNFNVRTTLGGGVDGDGAVAMQGVAHWYLRIVDNSDETTWPADPYAGFLPPNDPETHCGEGHISYRIKVRDDAPKNVVITNSATIVFDYNAPIETDPFWWNTVARFHDVSLEIDGVTTNLMLIAGEPFGELPTPTEKRTGYTFDAWYTGENGTGTKATPMAIVPTGEFSLYANWTANPYKVRFNANGGVGTMADQAFVYGTAQKLSANAFTRKMYAFAGWSLTPDGAVVYADKQSVNNLTATAGDVVTLYAVWEKTQNELWPDGVEGVAPTAAASEYNGYLYDEKSGAVKGTIQVKIGKANAKTGLAAVKATVVGLDGKKKSLKGADKGKAAIAVDGPTTIRLVGGEPCEVTLGAEGLEGAYGSYFIDGARNFFTSKDKGEQNAANAILSKWLGVINVAWREDGAARSASAPYQMLSVTIGKKGKAKVYVTLANGTKAMVNTQLLIGEEWLCVPVVVTKKMNLVFTLWLPVGGGAAVVDGLPGDVVVGKAGALKAGAKFRIDAEAFSARWGQRALPYLPDGVAVTANGTRWTLPKAGKVQMAKDGTVDEAKLGGNPAALKLTYKAKDGSFKGSFKAYSLVNGKPKAVTVNVAGVVVDGVGYGTATVKKVGSVPISIE